MYELGIELCLVCISGIKSCKFSKGFQNNRKKISKNGEIYDQPIFNKLDSVFWS